MRVRRSGGGGANEAVCCYNSRRRVNETETASKEEEKEKKTTGAWEPILAKWRECECENGNECEQLQKRQHSHHASTKHEEGSTRVGAHPRGKSAGGSR